MTTFKVVQRRNQAQNLCSRNLPNVLQLKNKLLLHTFCSSAHPHLHHPKVLIILHVDGEMLPAKPVVLSETSTTNETCLVIRMLSL